MESQSPSEDSFPPDNVRGGPGQNYPVGHSPLPRIHSHLTCQAFLDEDKTAESQSPSEDSFPPDGEEPVQPTRTTLYVTVPFRGFIPT